MQFVMSYSGGKDSALALYKMARDGHKPVGMITMAVREQRRSWFHGIDKDLLVAVSKSLEVPLILCKSSPGEYESIFEEALGIAKMIGAEACAFGDIDIAMHREWNESRCKAAGIECAMPLWGQGRENLVAELIEAGFKAKIKVVDTRVLDESFLGVDLDLEVVKRIKDAGSDPCGENGEYHTFVYDGPIFSVPVGFKKGEISSSENHKAIDFCLEA
ncbi:MAG: diphthine--ammonia ligase [Eubacteriaceae bacterium]|nr:diphthine--ammonia ligase [Eubacteriaceae bacterium]